MNKLDKNLTIIIVTFESSEVIEKCLSKINLSKYQVFVVDNNSQDNTVNIVEKEFPEVNLIKLDSNVGYGRANNIALQKTTTDYALILNPDAFIADEDIDLIIKLLNENSDFALAGPLLLNKYPPENNEIEKQKTIVQKNLIKTIEDNYSVSYVIGAIVFLKMAIFRKIGFFDPEIFMFYEDDEICNRVLKSGYQCVITGNCYGFHIGGGSSNKTFRNIFKRNLHLYLSKLIWKKKQKGYFVASKSALRLILVNLVAGLFNLFFDQRKLATNLGFAVGSFYFLIGLKPFKKDGRSRG